MQQSPDFKKLFELIKRGELSDVNQMVQHMGIDLQNLRNDEQNFRQTPLFEACALRDQDKSMQFVKYFLAHGVAATTQDDLKQIPLYYAVREGHSNVISTLLEQGSDVNHLDTYGQTAVFYCIREGNIVTTQQLVEAGAKPDVVDNNGQTPLFYAIRYNKFEMVEYLIQKGVSVRTEDKKGLTPAHWAKKHSKTQILDLLVQHGALPVTDSKKKAAKPRAEPEDKPVKEKVNERKIPRRYLLTTMREGGHYEPLTDAEFERFKEENPDVAKYFLETPDGSADLCPISELKVPEVNEGAPIYDHWEKAAQRLMMTLSRQQSAWIFLEPVNYKQLSIPDYPQIVKHPMDFGTIKTKLKEQQYANIAEFTSDVELVFYNCKLYNGEHTSVGQMGKQVHDEYLRLSEQLALDFYRHSLNE